MNFLSRCATLHTLLSLHLLQVLYSDKLGSQVHCERPAIIVQKLPATCVPLNKRVSRLVLPFIRSTRWPTFKSLQTLYDTGTSTHTPHLYTGTVTTTRPLEFSREWHYSTVKFWRLKKWPVRRKAKVGYLENFFENLNLIEKISNSNRKWFCFHFPVIVNIFLFYLQVANTLTLSILTLICGRCRSEG